MYAYSIHDKFNCSINNRTHKIYICLLIFLFVGLSFLLFINNTLATSNINYTFDRDVLYQENNPSYDTEYNMKQAKVSNGHYNATYSFENEVGLTNLQISYIDEVIGGTTDIIDSWYGHNEVLRMNSWESFYSNYSTYYSYFSMEYWFYKTEQTESTSIRFYDDSTRILLLYAHENDKWVYRNHKGGYTTLDSYEANVWYHLKFNFYPNSHFDFVVNGITMVNNQWCEANITYGINREHHTVGGNDDIYLDAIGYSWDYTFNPEVEYNFNEFMVNTEFNTSINPYIDWNYDISHCTYNNATIKNNNPIESKFIRLYDIESIAFNEPMISSNSFLNNIYGSVSFYIRTNDTRKISAFQLYQTTSLSALYIGIYNNCIAYMNPSTNYITLPYPVLNNTWYQIYLEFNCLTDTYRIWCNYCYLGNIVFTNNRDYITGFTLLARDYQQYYYIDFDLIQFSNDSISYNSLDNFYPYLENTGYYEPELFDFYFEGINDRYELLDTPIGFTKTTLTPDTVGTTLTGICTIGSNNGLTAIRNNNMNHTGYIINFTIDLYFVNFQAGHLFYINLTNIMSENSTILRFNSTGSLGYYDGSIYREIFSGFVASTDYKINIVMDYCSNIVQINYYTNEIYQDTTYISILNYDYNYRGINDIQLDMNADSLGTFFYIYNMSLFIDGVSKAYSYGYYEIRTNEVWILNNNNLVDFTGSGYIGMVATESNYLPFESSYSLDGSEMDIRNVYTSDVFNGYELKTYNLGSIIIFILGNTDNDYNCTYIEIHGCKLIEGINEYFLEYDYSNIEKQDSYFYVIGSTLYGVLISTNTNLEYIEATFNINEQLSTNYSVYCITDLEGLAFTEFKTHYSDDRNTIISLPYYDKVHNVLLSQDKQIDSFIILLTDNDIYSNNEQTICSIKNITLIYVSNIGLTIITETLMNILIPLVVIIAPTLLISIRYKRNTIIPMLILMCIITISTSLIPTWLFFMLMLSLIILLFTEKSESEI